MSGGGAGIVQRLGQLRLCFRHGLLGPYQFRSLWCVVEPNENLPTLNVLPLANRNVEDRTRDSAADDRRIRINVGVVGRHVRNCIKNPRRKQQQNEYCQGGGRVKT